MALLRQYSLLNLPQSWKASLISSYGSFLSQDLISQSPFHRNFMQRNSGALSGSTGPPLPPNSLAASAHGGRPLPAPPVPQVAQPPPPPATISAASGTSPPLPLGRPALPSQPALAASRKSSTTSSPSRSSPTNTKQRTYPCNECGKIFNAHYNLTRHMPVHTGN